MLWRAKKAGFPVVAVEDESARHLQKQAEAACSRRIAGYGVLIEELTPAGEAFAQALEAGLHQT